MRKHCYVTVCISTAALYMPTLTNVCMGWQLLTACCHTLCAVSAVGVIMAIVNIVQDATRGTSNCMSERRASCTHKAGCTEVQKRIGHAYHPASGEQ